MQVNLNRQIIHEGKVFVYAEGLGFQGFVPSPLQPKQAKPALEWTGGKIPVTLWQEVLSFFKAHKSDEVQVRLYYNPQTREWKAHAFPQQYPSGMTTKELPEHPNMAQDMLLFPEPWVRMGSVHHHCGATAFQSSTDHTDEQTVCGIHITVGKLFDATWDLHSRVCIRIPGALSANNELLYPATQAFYEADLTQWFTLPGAWLDLLPVAIQGMALKALMVTPPDNSIVFPQRWEDNLIRRALPNGSGSGHGGGYDPNRHTSPNSNGASGGYTHTSNNRPGYSQHTSKDWDTVTPHILDVIIAMMQVYHESNGKFICQVIETYNWKRSGFANIMVLEALLRGIGMDQVTKFCWAFPQDVDKAKKALQEMAEAEARRELQDWERQATEAGAAAGDGPRGAYD